MSDSASEFGICILFIALLVYGCNSQSEKEKEIDNLKTQIMYLNAQVDSQRRHVDEVEGDVDNIKSRLNM